MQSAETRVETQLALVGAHDAAVRDGELVQKVRDGGGRGVWDGEIAAEVEEAVGERLDGLAAMRLDGVVLQLELLLIVGALKVASEAGLHFIPGECWDAVDEVGGDPTRRVDIGDAQGELLRPLHTREMGRRAELLESKEEVDARGVRTGPLGQIDEEMSIDLR